MLLEAIKQDIEQKLYDGAVFLVAKGGKVVLHEAVGFLDRKAQRKMEKSSIFSIYSIAKTFTATMILDATLQGKLALTTPVSQLIPEFKGLNKEKVTIQHLLTHTGGLSSGLPQVSPQDLGNLERVIEAICGEDLAFSLGDVHYSPVVGFALLGKVLCVLDQKKRSFQTILFEDLFVPLKMSDSYCGLKETLIPRVVPVVFRDKTPGVFPPDIVEGLALLFSADSEIPGGGALSTAYDLFLFTEALKKRKWISRATQNYTGNQPNDLWEHARKTRGWGLFPAYLGLGFWLRGSGDFPTPFGKLTSSQTFGGIGLGSTLFWIDPVKDLTFICLTSGLMEESRSVERFEKLSDLVSHEVNSL